MVENLYNDRILKLAASLSKVGRIDCAEFSSEAISRLCGSKVTVDLDISKNTVNSFSHIVKACALGQASSSVMAKNIIGTDIYELLDLKTKMKGMLKDDGPPPSGKWSDLEVLQPVKDYKGRHSSVLLTFDAVENCINQYLLKSEKSNGEIS
jgi:NifU-like protein involved in Fe-S cluster formation